MGFKAYHLIESINKYSVIQFPIMTIQISDDSHIKNVLRTSNYEHADQYNIKLATKTYPLKSNKNKEHPMNPNPPKKKKKKTIKHHLIKKENRKNSKDPEKLTTVIDKGRHEQRLIIQKKQNPNNASEAQNPPHTIVVVVIVIIRKTKLKSI